MDIEKQNSLFSLIKFLTGTVGLAILAHFGNAKIQDTKLDMEAQKLEDKYIDSFLNNYGAKGHIQRYEYVNALAHLSATDSRKKRFSSLLAYLDKKATIDTESEKKNQETISKTAVGYEVVTEELIQRQAKKDTLTAMLKTAAAGKETNDLKLEIRKQNEELETLSEKTQMYQDSLASLETKSKKLALQIDNPNSIVLNTEPKIIKALPSKLVFDIQKSHEIEIEELGITIKAVKVNNILGRAYLWIKTGGKNNPAFSLKPGQFGIFSISGKSYKIKLNRTHNEDGIVGNSYAEIEISEES